MHRFDTVIETSRLILRPFTIDDIEPYYLINLDPEVSRYTGDGGVKSKEEIHEIIVKNIFGDYERFGFGRFAVDLKATGELIGFSGLKFMTNYDKIDLGYRFGKAFWGKGIATESGRASLEFGFNEIGLETIYGFILPENKASERVLHKLSFRYLRTFYEQEMEIAEYIISYNEYNKQGVTPQEHIKDY